MEISVRANGNAELVISKPATKIQQAAFDTFVEAVRKGLAIRVTVEAGDPADDLPNEMSASAVIVSVEDFKS